MNESNDRRFGDEALGAGRYRVRKLVAQSASGMVYEALDSLTGNVVEITVRPANVDDLQQMGFAHESNVLRLRIEGIAQVFDVGVDDGQYFEVRVRLDGPTLCTLLNTSRLTCRESATLIAKVAAAHETGPLRTRERCADIKHHSRICAAKYPTERCSQRQSRFRRS